jgi:hypothetical protein
MAQVSTVPPPEGFGATMRRDLWWLGPLATFLGLLGFLIYANYIILAVPNYFEIRQDAGKNSDWVDGKVVAPYLAPFHAPLLYDEHSPHAWSHQPKPGWWPSWFPFNSAMLILIFPAGFRLTCYYYRKAYYRAFWADPPACAVGEPRKSYWGENHWPLLLQNLHRYFMYFAVLFLVMLWWDALKAFVWPNAWDDPTQTWKPTGHTFGIGVGTLLMVLNCVFLTGYTFGCHSLRHLVGGRLNCFTCPNNPHKVTTRFKLWRISTWFNERHMMWAWLSLFSVGFTDFYIRMCASGNWTDPHFIV